MSTDNLHSPVTTLPEQTKTDVLRLYAIVRSDLGMSPGKIASQAGHAYLGAAVQADPAVLKEYHAEFPTSPGTKVCLQTDSVDKLKLALDKAQETGIPYFLVVDSGCPNFHGGEPIITALGLGPARRDEINHITRKFKLVE